MRELGQRFATQAVWLLFLMGMWMLFVVTTELPDIALGAGSAMLTLILVTVLRREAGRAILPRVRWLVRIGGLVPLLFSETVTVFGALFRQLFRGQPMRGAFFAVPYPGVYPDETEATAAAAFTIAANSLTPNSIVLDVDHLEGLVLLHQLVPRSPEQIRRSLVLPR